MPFSNEQCDLSAASVRIPFKNIVILLIEF